MTHNNNLELFKMNTTDRKVPFWMMDHNPAALKSWIEYIAAQYARKEIILDSDRLFRECIVEVSQVTDAGTTRTWRSKHVLLVDDESLFNFLHTRIL